jgi:hypothetical protein
MCKKTLLEQALSVHKTSVSLLPILKVQEHDRDRDKQPTTNHDDAMNKWWNPWKNMLDYDVATSSPKSLS